MSDWRYRELQIRAGPERCCPDWNPHEADGPTCPHCGAVHDE